MALRNIFLHSEHYFLTIDKRCPTITFMQRNALPTKKQIQSLSQDLRAAQTRVDFLRSFGATASNLAQAIWAEAAAKKALYAAIDRQAAGKAAA